MIVRMWEAVVAPGRAPGAAGGGDGDGGPGPAPSGLMFGPYKDTSIHMNWNTNVISTQVSGPMMPLAGELAGGVGSDLEHPGS